MEKLLEKYGVNANSFGFLCPKNWEIISQKLNDLIMSLARYEGIEEEFEFRHLCNIVWAIYCDEKLTGIPEEEME